MFPQWSQDDHGTHSSQPDEAQKCEAQQLHNIDIDLVIQLGKIAAILYLSWDCMKIGHGSNWALIDINNVQKKKAGYCLFPAFTEL